MTLLADVVATSARVAQTASRLSKTRELADCLRRLRPDEVEIALPYLAGEARQGRLTVGYRMLQAARTAPAGKPSLGIADVDAALESLKRISGAGSGGLREAALRSLFARATGEEQDFLFRLLVGELRQGALEGVMADALALAAGLPADEIRRAATFAGGLGSIARPALEQGAAGLARFSVQLMRPVLPMLAQPARDVESALGEIRPALLDWKVDGARVQVHKDGEEVRVFTRTLKEVTEAVPEIVASARSAGARQLILDGEAIALRPDGRPHPFQVTMRRFGRKLDDDQMRSELPLSVFFFDCLFASGATLVDRPLDERRGILEAAVSRDAVTPALVTGDPAEASDFYRGALERGHEGVMVKAPASRYEAGRRGGSWLKVKAVHTLDLVVLAAEWGNGRRRGWLSNLHLGARDAAGGFVMLGKTFKGLTDEILEWQTRELLARETGREGVVVRVRPELVAEIAFNDLQRSPHYPGGLALRFARLKRYRLDKTAAQADTIETVRRIFEAESPA